MKARDADHCEVSFPVEAYGVKGMNSKAWRRTFKNRAALDRWLEKNDGDVEVHGTRVLEDPFERAAVRFGRRGSW